MEISFSALNILKKDTIQNGSKRAAVEVIVIEPYPIGILSQLESIPVASVWAYINVQRVHTR